MTLTPPAQRLGAGVASAHADDGTPSAARALFRMTRPRTMPLSAALIAIGAYGAEHSFGFLTNPALQGQLALVTVLVMATTATSMIVNDYYDYHSGADTLKGDKRPLVLQQVTPPTVKAACKWLYAAHLGLLLFVRHSSLRACIYLNTLATYLYTRHFKPITGVKNLLCAGVIATTVALGAAVVKGTMAGGLMAVWPLVVTVGCGILHREIVMDVVDVDGDRAAGLRTLPTVFGRRGAVGIAVLPLLLAIGILNTAGAGAVRSPLVSSVPIAAMCALAARAASHLANAPEQAGRSLDLIVEASPALLFVSLLLSLQ